HLAASGENELVLQLAGALSVFWQEGGHVAEGGRRLDGALQGQGRPTAARARALTGAALMAYGSGDVEAARSIAAQALELNRSLGNARGAAFNLNVLCVAAIEEGDLEQAEQLAEESLALFRQAGDEREAVAATRTLAFTYHRRGDLERARALHESNLAQARALGFKETEVGTLGSLAMIAFEQGRIEDALALGKQNLLACRDLGSLQGIAQSLCRSAGTFAVLPGKENTAARLLSCFESHREQLRVSD